MKIVIGGAPLTLPSFQTFIVAILLLLLGLMMMMMIPKSMQFHLSKYPIICHVSKIIHLSGEASACP